MFDISLFEFFLAAVVALVVLGPNRLPGALRTLGLWLGRLRRSYYNVKSEIEREIGMDDVRRQLHNEQVMADVRRVEREVRALGTDAAGLAEAEPSAGEREGPAPRMEEPSAGEREGPAPRMEEPSAGEREGPAPAQTPPEAAPTAAPGALSIEHKAPAQMPPPDESPVTPPGQAGEPDAAAGSGRSAAGADAPRHSGE